MLEHNAQMDAPFEMGINEFSDMTDEEIEQKLLVSGGVLISSERKAKLKAIPVDETAET